MQDDKKSVYIETTIPSFATGRPSIDTITAGKQAATLLFWEQKRYNYKMYVSQYVIDECKLGDPEAAQRRLNFIKDIEILSNIDEVNTLATMYQQILDIPERATTDSFHLSSCVIAKINYLLSWNCTHLGIATYAKLRSYNEEHSLWTPLLVTPDFLINSEEDI
ncbi:hypothetical protein RsTz2092_04520 [Deferribacterales bacterium RsTz2092]